MTENQTNEMFRLMNNMIQGLESLRTEFDANREETKQNFTDVKTELRFMNRKFEVYSDDMVEIRARMIDVEKRVDVLEDKDAA